MTVKMELHWVGDDKNMYLFAGSNETELAWLEKRRKLWSAVVWLPGVDRGREYDTLPAHQRNIEVKVQHWFASARRKTGAQVPKMSVVRPTNDPQRPTMGLEKPGANR